MRKTNKWENVLREKEKIVTQILSNTDILTEVILII